MKEQQARKLFTPLQLGALELEHRVVMPPLTRSRSIQPDSIPGDLMAEYYAQRASEGGFIIAEATNISVTSRGWLARRAFTQASRWRGGKKLFPGCGTRADTCSRNCGTRDAPLTLQ